MRFTGTPFLLGGLLLVGLLLGCPSNPPGPTGPEDDVVFAFGQWNSAGDFDVRLKKFDLSGVEDTASWDKTIDHSSEYTADRMMAMDSAGSVYVAYASYNSPTGYDWRIKKFASTGVEDTSGWDKTIDGSMNNGHDWPKSLVVDHQDDVYLVGYFSDGVTATTMNWCIKKYDSDGTEITTGWNKIVDGGAAVSPDYPRAAAVDSAGNLYVAGELYPSGRTAVIKKYSPAGVEDTANWNKSVSSSVITYCSLTVDSNDNIYVGGEKNDDLSIRKFSQSGTEDAINWDKTIDIGFADRVFALAVDSNDNLYAGGFFSDGMQTDWFLKKFTSGGVEVTTGWDKQYDSGSEDRLGSIAIGGLDDVYVFAVVSDGGGAYDWLIKKYDQDGTEDESNWDKYLSAGTGSDAGATILVDFSY